MAIEVKVQAKCILYFGCCKEGQYDGVGTGNFDDGGKYNGQWRAGKPHGYGIYSGGEIYFYQGEWCDGIAHGYGVYMVKTTREKYYGHWNNGFLHGYYVLCPESGTRTQGHAQNGLLPHIGAIISDKAIVCEEIVTETPVRVCKGSVITKEFSYYGEIVGRNPHGRGVMIFTDGNCYFGGVQNGMRHGTGIMVYIVGRHKMEACKSNAHIAIRYEGEFKYNKIAGDGTFTYLNDCRYIATRQDGVLSGEGTIIDADNVHYHGVWKDNREVTKFVNDKGEYFFNFNLNRNVVTSAAPITQWIINANGSLAQTIVFNEQSTATNNKVLPIAIEKRKVETACNSEVADKRVKKIQGAAIEDRVRIANGPASGL